MKRVILYIFILLVPLLSCLAFGTSEATSEESWILAHSSVNNDNKYWDVSQSLTPGIPSAIFTPASDNGLFRIRTNYGRTYTDNKYRKVEIAPIGNGWNLVSDNNATLMRPYSIEIYEIAWTRNSPTGTPSQSGSTSLKTPTISNDTISFTMSSATWDSTWSFSTGTVRYAKKFYDYEIVIKLPAMTEQEQAALEPGSYHASFKVSLYLGSDGGSLQEETYTIKGVFGETSTTNTDYAFLIDSTTFTYGVDLSETSTYFDIAEVKFQSSDTSDSKSGESTIINNNKNKYKVLISPFSNYELDTGSDNPYLFVLNGTENMAGSEINRVPYGIYKNASGDTFSLYNNSYKHTYVITPTLEVSGTERNWVLSWSLDQLIYIKPEAPSNTTISRAAGFYKTSIYFFVVTN